MSFILNVLWFIFGGFISGTLWLFAGVVCAITVIGLPWAPAVFRLASLAYWPFGRTIVDRPSGVGSALLNIIWLIFAGWWLALHHILLAVGLAVTIIGIPFALQHLKMAMLALAPVSKSVVPA
ncbi:MAG TPA: YccF domain-containing protein [Caulobacteraceae bacterium]|jgi:uncharacterized membrane protein YccF (DUF307 family)